MESEQAEVLLRVVRVFTSLGIVYQIGGSVASSIHGFPRFTQDIDVAARITAEHVPHLISALEAEFYIDASMIRDAIRRQASFNIIHLESLNKIDIFVTASHPWAVEEETRRVPQLLQKGDERSLVYVSSPEDTILHKLEWYQMGGGISDRQWSDVIGVLRVQGESLDQAYLQRWAVKLGVENLLKQGIEEASAS